MATRRGATGPRHLSRLPGDQRVLRRQPPPARRWPSRAALGEGTGADPPAPRRARHAARTDPLPDQRRRRRAAREFVPPPGVRARTWRRASSPMPGQQPGRRPGRGPRGGRRPLRRSDSSATPSARNRRRPRSSGCSGSSSTLPADRRIAAERGPRRPAADALGRRSHGRPSAHDRYVPKRRREEARRRFDGADGVEEGRLAVRWASRISPVGAPDRHRRRIGRAGASGGGTGAD